LKLPPMADTDVSALRDIGLLEDVLGKQLARLRSKRERIFRNRTPLNERQITDHAIVRYLERVGGIDMEAAKARIREFVGDCTPTDVKGILRHPTGVQVVVSTRGLVVTILPEDAPAEEWVERGDE
jgi:hypothetical protein